MHHMAFKRTTRRTVWSYLHLGIGRVTIPVGIINAVLGAKLGNLSTAKCAAIGIVGGLVWLVYAVCAAFGEWRRSRRLRMASKTPEGGQVEGSYERIRLGGHPRGDRMSGNAWPSQRTFPMNDYGHSGRR
jgi:hypothetical protein